MSSSFNGSIVWRASQLEVPGSDEPLFEEHAATEAMSIAIPAIAAVDFIPET